jgi:uncharacterized membrane protein
LRLQKSKRLQTSAIRGNLPAQQEGTPMTEIDTRPPATPTPTGFDFNRPTIIGLLYAGSYFTAFTGIIGLVLCYVWRNEPHEPWEATHYSYNIRTFWIGLVVGIIGFITLIIGIGFLILLALFVWTLVRIVLSIVNAQKRAPMPNPETLFF